MAAPGADGQQKRRRGRPSPADLLLSCDLPPPATLFGPRPTLHRLESDGGNDDLRRALRLSQSRAREAEQKLAACHGGLAALLVRDSMVLSSHRRWVLMLEAENSVLKAAGAEPEAEEEKEEEGARHAVAAAWWVALAVCVVGLALGSLLL